VSDEDLLNRGLPKWPQMIVTGPRLREDLALEVVRRTDSWFVSGHGCNDRDGDRRLAQRFRMPHFRDYSVREPEGFDWRAHWDRGERWKKAWGVVETQYVHNTWVGSSFIFGPYGWCRPDGQIYYSDNVGKYPSVQEIRADWQTLATAFPFLVLTVTLMSGEGCDDDTHPVVAMEVADGQVKLKEPNVGDHGAPRRDFGVATIAAIALPSALRERYPFREDVLLAWEQKAREVDAEVNSGVVDVVPARRVGSEVPPDARVRAVTAEDYCMDWGGFVAACRDGMFTVNDGYGELATDLQVSDVRVDPSDALNLLYARPSWATHVCWYNK